MKFVFLFSLLGLTAACVPTVSPRASPDTVRVKPSEFAILPCAPQRLAGRCALAVAGGKNILFGAPSSVGHALNKKTLQNLDAIVLLSMAAEEIEGLDEVRNQSWYAGRDDPLLVIGPEGSAAVIGAINTAFEPADALRVVEQGLPAGGFDAAILVSREAPRSGGIMFDTGDVRVTVSSDWAIGVPGPVSLTYRETHRLVFLPCGAKTLTDLPEEGALMLGCDTAQSDLTWPLSAPYFIVQETGS